MMNHSEMVFSQSKYCKFTNLTWSVVIEKLRSVCFYYQATRVARNCDMTSFPSNQGTMRQTDKPMNIDLTYQSVDNISFKNFFGFAMNPIYVLK